MYFRLYIYILKMVFYFGFFDLIVICVLFFFLYEFFGLDIDIERM